MRQLGHQLIDASDTPRTNQLLAALPGTAYQRLLPDLKATTLQVGQTLIRPARPLQFAYFPTSSIITLSYTVGDDGAMAKAWPVGREGIVGISLFLGSVNRDNRADVQIGGLAFRLSASALLAEFRRAGALQQLLLRYVFALVTQASQIGVCSHYHPLEQRLCRFLSRTFDQVSGDTVAITQNQIGTLLGVRRVTVSQAAGHLQAAGIIEYTRGLIRLVSREKLEKRACGCAAIIRRAFNAVTE